MQLPVVQPMLPTQPDPGFLSKSEWLGFQIYQASCAIWTLGLLSSPHGLRTEERSPQRKDFCQTPGRTPKKQTKKWKNDIPKKDLKQLYVLKWWSQWRSTASYQTKNKKSKHRIYSNITFQELEEFNQMKKRPQLKSKNHKRVFIVSYLHVWCGRLLRFSAFSRQFWAGFPL